MTRLAMHFGGNLILLFSGFLGGAWIILNTAPQEVKLWQLVLLYFSIFLLIFNLAFFFGYALRKILWKRTFVAGALGAARRQGLLLALLAITALILQAADFLSYKTAIPLVLIFLILELYGQ